MDTTALLDEIVELERVRAAVDARLASAMASFVAAARSEVLGGEFATDEIAVALRCGRGRVLEQVRLAETVREQLPTVWAVWRAGEIDGYKAGRVLEAAERLIDPALLADFDTAAAAAAVTKTAPQLSSWLSRRVAKIEPDQVEPRYRRAFSQRRVGTSPDLDGMGRLWATTTALDLTAIDVKLTRMAESLGVDDPRTLEQRRVDLFVDLLLGRTDSRPADAETATAKPAGGGSAAPCVAVTVPIQSLLGADTTAALTSGGGPVPASVAREILARPGTLVYRLLTDPVGNLLDVAQLSRFPTSKLGFAVAARDQHCRFPCCTRPGVLCDCDHTIPHPEGATSYANLGLLCRRHHRMKTKGHARLGQVEPGVFEWTMPTGGKHTVRAEPQPVASWPAEPHPPPDDPPMLEPQLHAHDIAALLLDGGDPETLTGAELDALLPP